VRDRVGDDRALYLGVYWERLFGALSARVGAVGAKG
jgi:hypothetical protein